VTKRVPTACLILEIGSSYFAQHKQGLINHIRKNLPESPDLQFLAKNGVTLAYSYKDSTGADVVTLRITSQEYGQTGLMETTSP